MISRCGMLFVALVACAHAQPAAVIGPANPARFELVESQPVETSLDKGLVREAYQVWPEIIARARQRLDFAEMYSVDQPPSRLTPIIDALVTAMQRGVKVRYLASASFAQTYPEVLAALAAHGAEVRKLQKPFLHAKYFVADGREAYLGSQNFDWRSMEHIQELGVRFDEPTEVAALEDVFETDWTGELHATTDSGALRGSPQGPIPWDLPVLVRLLDSAQKSVRVQVLTWSDDVTELRDAMGRAAARGVAVQLLTSNWELRPKTLRALRALDRRIETRIFIIPEARGGFVPYARVAHAKYCVVDGMRGWVGTGNWERDYFEKSRNVGLFFTAGQIPAQLEAFFTANWNSPYAAAFDPARDYSPPKISKGETP
jgi:phosphatidylserine/phosphatidylglycerophosphate/cardiolipin synthase-like enzyme